MKLHGCFEKERHGEDAIHEEKEEEDKQTDAHAEEANVEEPDASLATISDDIRNLLAFILRVEDSGESPVILGSIVEKFMELVEKELAKCESGEEEMMALFDSVGTIFKLTTAAASFSSEPGHHHAMNRASSVMHHAICYLEDEFYTLLYVPCADKMDSDTDESAPPYPERASRSRYSLEFC